MKKLFLILAVIVTSYAQDSGGVGILPVIRGGTGAKTAASARTNLGVTASGSDTTYSFRANNLSDLASAVAAWTNLGGLGTIGSPNFVAINLYDTVATTRRVTFQSTSTGISADRVVTVDIGNTNRTITLSGNPTLADWFDQSVKTTASPSFTNETITTRLTLSSTSGSNTGGIIFSSDAYIFRNSANNLSFVGGSGSALKYYGQTTQMGADIQNAPVISWTQASPGSPGYGFYNTNAGMYSSNSGATSHLLFATNSTLAMDIDGGQNVSFSAVIKAKNYIVSALPAASSWPGGLVYVTDATLTAITGLGLAVTGGSTNKVIVYSDGTNWIIL